MANKPVSIEFVADVAKYLREVKKMDVATEDIADALVATSNSADDLERKLSRAMKDSAKDTEVLERALKDVGDAADHMGDEAARGFEQVGDEAREAGRETGENFRQSLGESLGSGGDLGEVLTETLGEAVGGLGGAVGVAAGIIAGGALLVFNQIKAQIEATNAAIVAQTESMWSTALGSIEENIGKVAIRISNTALVQAEVSRLWADSADEMVKLVDAAETLNINANDLVLARAGDEAALKRVNTAMGEVYEQQNTTNTATVEQLGAVQDVEDAIYRAGSATDVVNAKVKAHNDSLAETATAIELIADKQDEWKAGIQQTQAEIDTLRAGLEADPFNLDIRLRVDSSALRQLFPYGTSSQADVDRVVAGFNPYGTKPRTG